MMQRRQTVAPFSGSSLFALKVFSQVFFSGSFRFYKSKLNSLAITATSICVLNITLIFLFCIRLLTSSVFISRKTDEWS